MTPLIASDSPLSWVVVASAVGFAASEVSIRVRGALQGRGSARVDRGSIVVVVLGLVLGLVSALWAASRLDAVALPDGFAVLGCVLVWLGVVVRQWAVWVLGRFFTVVVRVAADQSVVDRGPYRWVRHPSYTGLLISCLGLGLGFANAVSGACLLVFPLAGLVVRIMVEERALVSALGQPYVAYAETRRRLVPGLW
jgi:protein-S-isoprenylcysteine O-methyltransferase Ste14